MVDEISWVQCDKCQEWFHCMCVRLTKETAEKIDSYVCDGCCKQALLNSKSSQGVNSNASSGTLGGGGHSKTNIGLVSSIKQQSGVSGGHSAVRLHSYLQT